MRSIILLSGVLACLLGQPAFAEEIAGEAPIHLMAKEGNGVEVARILKADPKMRDVRSPLGSTPLHFAATNADRSAMTVLLAAGADPNARDAEGSTPLHMAAYASKGKNVQQLLEAGADPLLKNNAGRDSAAMARKVKADEAAGVLSLWMLKGCKAGKPC
ncbi:MAG: ankyrin repeat domain-containing protein [Betaproteobacteria bacterium]|nr:ankyrin repeat domain-containing protein [Betaproteobacteria bacterium]